MGMDGVGAGDSAAPWTEEPWRAATTAPVARMATSNAMRMASFRRIGVLLCDHDSVQHEPEDMPVAEAAPVGQGSPEVEASGAGLTVKASGGGLSPPTPNSVEPSGMPIRA